MQQRDPPFVAEHPHTLFSLHENLSITAEHVLSDHHFTKEIGPDTQLASCDRFSSWPLVTGSVVGLL